MKRAFTLIELLVVIAIISLLMAIGLPVMKQVRERGAEAVCQSNLRQLEMILKAYTSDHDGIFPNPPYVYHSEKSFIGTFPYPDTCRWHDAEIGLDSPLLTRDRREFQGDLVPYLGNPEVLRCKTGVRANLERGCNNSTPCWRRTGQSVETVPTVSTIALVPQYTYTMNACLRMRVKTGAPATGSIDDGVALKTIREVDVHKETQVTRSPSEVFAFGEENSWSVNTTGEQPGASPNWPASCNLSGSLSAIRLGDLVIQPSYSLGSYEAVNDRVVKATLMKKNAPFFADAFATYHRPRRGDLNAGHSYISMLDGHVEKVTVADQLRASRRDPSLNMPESRFGPGGNLRPAWPLDVPPLGGWENQ